MITPAISVLSAIEGLLPFARFAVGRRPAPLASASKSSVLASRWSWMARMSNLSGCRCTVPCAPDVMCLERPCQMRVEALDDVGGLRVYEAIEAMLDAKRLVHRAELTLPKGAFDVP